LNRIAKASVNRRILVLLSLFLIFSPALPAGSAAASRQETASPAQTPSQTSASSAKKKKPAAKASKAKKKPAAGSRGPNSPTARAALSRRAQRIRSAFVASAELRPMAQQLLQARNPKAFAGVESWARSHATTEAGGLAYLALGYAHFLDHDFEKSIADLKKAQPHAGEVSDYVAYYLATSYVALGSAREAMPVLSDFGARYPDSLFARDLAVLYANLLIGDGQPQKAITVLAPYRTPYRTEVELVAGRAYLRANNVQKGVETLRHIYYTAPASAQADQAGIELQAYQDRSDIAPPTFADRQKRADLLLDARRYADAAREYHTLLAGTQPPNVAELQVNLGIALYRSGNRTAARETLEAIPEQSAEHSDIDARRYYYLGEIARANEDRDRFATMISRLRQLAPTSPWLGEALFSAGNMYLLRKDYEEATKFYREIYERFPQGKYASYVHWKTTWLTLRLGKREEGRQLLEEQVRLFPASTETPPALYWRARIAEDQRDYAVARAYYQKLSDRFRLYYYADLARDRLRELKPGDVADEPLLQRIPDPQPPVVTNDPAPAENVRLQKSLLLRNAAMFDLAVRELQAATSEANAAWVNREIARVYQEEGLYHRALESLKRTLPSYFAMEIASMPRPYWEMLFPRPWWQDVKRYSDDNRLDPYLVASLIRQESEFNPVAISPANAFGLMQILPSVGSKLAKGMKLRPFSNDMLLMPETNVRLGTRYFKELLDKYNGKVEYALAAYNAGTDRVQEWQSRGTYRDTAEFVESIPFTETREYVQAIMRNTNVYRRLYGTP
jgi:soluble lytic murein transglycosylase